MKIAVSVTVPDAHAALDPRFGRAAAFVIVDTATGEQQAVANPALELSGGAGIRAAEFVVGQGAEAVISGAFGPKASGVLNASGVRLYQAKSGTVDDLLGQLTKGELAVWEGG